MEQGRDTILAQTERRTDVGEGWICRKGDHFQKECVTKALHAALDKNPKTKVTIENYEHRSKPQNRLVYSVYPAIAKQSSLFVGEPAAKEKARAYCKLHFGVPILRAECSAFKAQYDRVFKHMNYEDKLEAIEIFRLPVTSQMTKRQLSKYIDQCCQHFASNGVVF